ncbi:MAG: PAS domain-containing sensor histidine kinase [Bacteroidota bacterium]
MKEPGPRTKLRFPRVIQYALLFGGILVLISGLYLRSILTDPWDPLWARALITLAMFGVAALPSSDRKTKTRFYSFTSLTYMVLGAWLLVLIYRNPSELPYWFQLWLFIGLAAVLMQPVMRYWWFAGILSLGLLLISSLSPKEIIHAYSQVPWMLLLLLSNGIILDYRNRSGKRIRAMAQLSEYGPIPIFEVNGEGKVQYVNQQFSHLLGFKLEEVSNTSIFDLITPISLPASSWLLDTKQTYELVFRRKDGTNLPTLVNLSSIKEWEDDQVTIIGSITEITELKDVEHQLKERNEQMDLFLYKATHDLKGPLASVKGILDIALQNCQQPEISQYIHMALTSTDKLDQALIDLLHVTRLNKADLIIEQVNCKELVEDILFSLQHMPESRKVEFDISVADSHEFYSDKNTLTTILQNLIVNAIKYKGEGSQLHRVSVKIIPQDLGIHIEVADNGEGIKPEIQVKVFTMFYRGNKKSKGTGLGLYIVKQGTEKLGGTLSLVSDFGKGSTFSLYIPSSTPIQKELSQKVIE